MSAAQNIAITQNVPRRPVADDASLGHGHDAPSVI